MVQISTNTTLGVESPMGRKIFIFDRVFGEEVDQRGVYDYLQESVDSFLQGYNVSILAYGQSGAGKSYTMGTSGPREQNHQDTKGVIPRAAAHLFDYLNGEQDTASRPHSGLKSPTRYSVGNIQTILQTGMTNGGFAKTNGDKDWELSATYVEVYPPHQIFVLHKLTTYHRSTTNNPEICYSRILCQLQSDQMYKYVRTSRVAFMWRVSNQYLSTQLKSC
jgi:hypothetical protein